MYLYTHTHTQCETIVLFSELANMFKVNRQQQHTFKNRRKKTGSSQSQARKGYGWESHEETDKKQTTKTTPHLTNTI